MEKAYEEEARAAEKLDAKLAIELRWLERGVTARRRRNQGRLAKLHDMRAQRAAMIGGPGAAKLAVAKDDVRSKAVIDADRVSKSYGDRTDHPRLHLAHPARRPDRHRRAERRREDDAAEAADWRAAARPGEGRAREDLVGHRHRPAAQADGAGQARPRRAGRGWRLDRRPRLEEAHQGLSEGIPFLARTDRSPGRLAVGWRKVAAAARP